MKLKRALATRTADDAWTTVRADAVSGQPAHIPAGKIGVRLVHLKAKVVWPIANSVRGLSQESEGCAQYDGDGLDDQVYNV